MEDKQDEPTDSDGSGMESDDPLTATDTKYGKSFRYLRSSHYAVMNLT